MTRHYSSAIDRAADDRAAVYLDTTVPGPVDQTLSPGQTEHDSTRGACVLDLPDARTGIAVEMPIGTVPVGGAVGGSVDHVDTVTTPSLPVCGNVREQARREFPQGGS